MLQYKFLSSFGANVRPIVGQERDKYLSKASIEDIKAFIPNIDIEKNIDLLPIAFNACVVGRGNKNGDIIDTQTALAIAPNFINKSINIEHNRQHIIGVIVSYGFSEFGTDKPLTQEQVSGMTGPFNLVLGAVLWKVVNPELTDKIEESNDPSSLYYLSISASWELGFSEFYIASSKDGSKNLEDCSIITDDKIIESLQKYLKVNGGTGILKDGTAIYRKVVGTVVPLGIGLTENPAAEVRGIAVNTDSPSRDIKITDSCESSEHKIVKCSCGAIISQCKCSFPNKPVEIVEGGCAACQEKAKSISQLTILNVNTDSNKSMKISSLADINDTNWKELSASIVTQFVAEEMKKANDKFIADKTKDEDALKASQAASQQLKDDYAGLKTSLEGVQAELQKLQAEKVEKDKVDQFNNRMGDVHASYALTDDIAKVVAAQVKNCADDDSYANWKSSMSVFLKPFERQAAKAAEEAAAAKVKADNEAAAQVKADADAKAAADEAKAKEISTASATKVVEDALNNGKKEKELPNSMDGKKPTLFEKYAQAFSLEDGFTVSLNRR